MKLHFVILMLLVTCIACNPWKRDFPPAEYEVKGRLFDADGKTPLTNFKLEMHYFSMNYFHNFDTLISTTTTDLNGFYSFTYPHIKKKGGTLKLTNGKETYFAGIERNQDFERDITVEPHGILDIKLLNIDKLKSFDTLYFLISHAVDATFDSIPYNNKFLKCIVLTFHHDNSRVMNLKLRWDGDLTEYSTVFKRYFIVWGLSYEKLISNYQEIDKHLRGDILGFPYRNEITLDVFE